MGFLYEKLVRPALFHLDPEVRPRAFGPRDGPARRGGAACGGSWRLRPGFRRGAPGRSSAWGCCFPNAVGLAAGFDKNGIAWRGAAALGFGHVEIGTVTLLGQPGNERPRAFRYPAHEAVINRMGFNNQGAETVARRLARLAAPGTRRIPLGINLGKSRAAPLEQGGAGLRRELRTARGPRRLRRDQCEQPEYAGSAPAPGGTLAAGASARADGGEPGAGRVRQAAPSAPAEDRP